MTQDTHGNAGLQMKDRLERRRSPEAPLAMLTERDLAMLLMMARVGRVQHRHLAVVWRTPPHRATLSRRTQILRQCGLIVSARWGVHLPTRTASPPLQLRHHGFVHVLTSEGQAFIQDRYPQHDFTLEKIVTQGKGSPLHQIDHQMHYADMVVSVIDGLAGYPGIIGISSASEIMLGPGRSPRADGFLIIRRWRDGQEGHMCDPEKPYRIWLTQGVRPGQIQRAFIIEVDCNSEPPGVIARKAQDYRAVYESRWWVGKYPWPLPLWIVPTERRQAVIVREWLREWPESPLMITTMDVIATQGVHEPIWTFHYRGKVVRACLLPETWRQMVIPERDHGDQQDGTR